MAVQLLDYPITRLPDYSIPSYHYFAMKAQLLALIILASCAIVFSQEPKAEPKPGGTEISADLGSCSAAFHVTNMVGKPLYNAKIRTQIRYGFLAKRKLDLEVATDSAGKAIFTKLPNELKRPPMTFSISYGSDTAELSYDPATNCRATYEVPLGKKTEEKGEKPEGGA